MRYFLQQVILMCVSLFITSQIFSGVTVNGIPSYLFSSFIIIVGFAFLKPIINTITLPIAALTFNLTSFLSTVIIIYITTVLNPLFKIDEFTFNGFSVFGYAVPGFSANLLLSYLLISATIHIVYKVLYYVFDL